MSTKLNSIILPNNIINRMKVLLEETKIYRLEYGFDVCGKNNDLIIRNECRGTLCSINLPQQCETGERLIGDYHTHPRPGTGAMSDTDMYDACGLYFSCVGSSYFGQDRITCLIRKPDTNKIDCQKDVLPEDKGDNRKFLLNYNRLRDKYFRQIDILLKGYM